MQDDTLKARGWIESKAMRAEFDADLGDARRTQRARRAGVAVSMAPGLSFPKIFADEASLEGFYRLVENDDVSWRELVGAHATQAACCRHSKTAAFRQNAHPPSHRAQRAKTDPPTIAAAVCAGEAAQWFVGCKPGVCPAGMGAASLASKAIPEGQTRRRPPENRQTRVLSPTTHLRSLAS